MASNRRASWHASLAKSTLAKFVLATGGLLTLTILPVKAMADLPPVYHVGEVTLSDTSTYFTSKANYDRYGDKVDLPSDSSGQYYFNTQTNSIDGAYDLATRLGVWRFGAGLDINDSTSRGPDVVYGGDQNRSNSQFDDVHFLLQKPIPLQQFRIIPEFKGTVTFNPINYSRVPYTGVGTDFYNDALTSDDCDIAQIGSWFVGNFPYGSAYAYVGYEYRDSQYSALLPYAAGGLFRYNQFLVGAEIDGFDYVTNDQYNPYNNYPRHELTERVDGNSYKYFATNPIESDFRINAGYSFSPNFSVNAGWSNTISGQETAIGQTYLVSLAYSFDVTGGANSQYNDDLLPRNTAGAPQSNSSGKFQPRTEKYDKSLFESD